MAVLNVRVDNQVRDQLKEMADNEGITLSEFVRALLLEAVVPVYEDKEVRRRSEELTPERMRLVDRQTLSLLHRILARVLPEDANDVDGDAQYQLMRATILESGFTAEYSYEVAGFRTELSRRDCRRVSDILQMFRILTYSVSHLEKEGTPVAEDLARALEFQGFDFNESLEDQMDAYVKFQMRDGDRWTELQPQIERTDGGNSHVPMLETYMRMLVEYRRIMDGRDRGSYDRHDYLMSAEELQQIRDARIHPSRRRESQD